MFDDPIKKPTFTDSGVATPQAAVFVERQAHVDRQQAHFASAAFEKGVVGGLTVAKDAAGTKLVVTPGAAVDGNGRLVVLGRLGRAQVGGAPVAFDVPSGGFLVPVGVNFAHLLLARATDVAAANLGESATLVAGVDVQPALVLVLAAGYVLSPLDVVLAYVTSTPAGVATVALAPPGNAAQSRVEAGLLGGGLWLRESNTAALPPGLRAANGGIEFVKGDRTPVASVSSGGVFNAASGVFAGAISAASGGFTGALTAASGVFAGAISAASGVFTGAISAVNGVYTGSISAVNGVFSGAISGAGALTAPSAAFAGPLTAATATIAGTAAIKGDLNVDGDIAVQSKHAIQGNDPWLRLNQRGDFTSGVHTPGLFAPNSLNVGGVNGWGPVTAGNIAVAGDIEMEAGHTVSSKGRMHISGAELLYLLNTQGVIISKAWGGNGELTVEGNATVQGEVSAGGWYIRVAGAGGERTYIGGDGVSNDAQIGSENPDVRTLAVWNTGGGLGWMQVAGRDFACHSDERSKSKIEALDGALAQVLKLRPVSFDWKDAPADKPAPRNLGLIAQEVASVVPEAVVADGRDGLSIRYAAITATLARAMQEQHLMIEALRDEVQKLQRRE